MKIECAFIMKLLLVYLVTFVYTGNAYWLLLAITGSVGLTFMLVQQMKKEERSLKAWHEWRTKRSGQ